MQEAELTYIEGTVDAVIYQNRENGYTVLRLDAGEGRGLTVVGCLPGVAPGESISVQGTWMHHASYGEQFKAEAVERRMPAGTKAIFDYLASGAVHRRRHRPADGGGVRGGGPDGAGGAP